MRVRCLWRPTKCQWSIISTDIRNTVAEASELLLRNALHTASGVYGDLDGWDGVATLVGRKNGLHYQSEFGSQDRAYRKWGKANGSPLDRPNKAEMAYLDKRGAVTGFDPCYAPEGTIPADNI